MNLRSAEFNDFHTNKRLINNNLNIKNICFFWKNKTQKDNIRNICGQTMVNISP